MFNHSACVMPLHWPCLCLSYGSTQVVAHRRMTTLLAWFNLNAEQPEARALLYTDLPESTPSTGAWHALAMPHAVLKHR